MFSSSSVQSLPELYLVTLALSARPHVFNNFYLPTKSQPQQLQHLQLQLLILLPQT
jgi:ABC-type uncharacterized transport system substrate-binding protein